MNIYTGSYANCQLGNLVSISLDKGKSADFIGDSYIGLAPQREFFRIWKDNKTLLSEDANNLYYMKEFYKKVLCNLDPKKVLEDLSQFGDNVIILCYENSDQFCHRHLVAAWLEKELNIKVPEIAIDSNGNTTILNRNTKYVEQFYEVMLSCDK